MLNRMRGNPSLGVKGEDEKASKFIVLVKTENRLVSAEQSAQATIDAAIRRGSC